MPLFLQIMVMLTWKDMPCVEFLQIAYCVNCYIVILTYLAIAVNEAFFCDCYRNMGHFLCSVERIKRFVNVHLHRHSSAMFLLMGANTQDQNCCAVKSHSHALATFQSNGKARKQEAIWMKCVFCSYFDKIICLLYNPQNLQFIKNSTYSALK